MPAHAAEHARQASMQHQDDMSSQSEESDTGADAMVGDSRLPSDSLPESGSQQKAAQPAADDWGDFVS